ncbi:hypothetical protein GQ53DRAFT_768178 [Thozetella sp. PMI_491]|nr:hypothetical protein GQ53DRAFT_768178 [Thozetella sp. PMI_491]
MPSPHTVVTPPTSNAAATTKPSPAATYSGKLYASPPPKNTLPGIDLEAGASRNYSYQSPYQNTARSDSQYPHPHISSAVSAALPSQAFFSAAALPRTSSLLPPPRLAAESGGPKTQAFQSPIDVATTRGARSDSVNDLESSRRRHSRSSSTGGLNESLRSLNRWSASTASSRASVKTSTARRMSVDVTVAPPVTNTPRKLQKQRPSISSQPPQSPERSRKTSIPESAPIPPLQSLPQIATLPSLEFDVSGSGVLAGLAPSRSPRPRPRPTDDQGFGWDEPKSTIGQPSPISSPFENFGPLMAPPAMARDSTMPRTQNGEVKGHTRSRSTQNGSTDTTATNRTRSSKTSSQKAMLSKALQKANTAVEFDNAANFEGARSAYSEACELLQQVLQRTSGEEDRKKLEAIRKTYTSRIDELNQLLPPPQETKALPRRPDAVERFERPVSPFTDPDDAVIETARVAKIGSDLTPEREQQPIPSYSRPTNSRANATPTPTLAFEAPRDGPSGSLTEQYSLQSSFSKSTKKPDTLILPRPMDQQYMPPPLSPRRTPSPMQLANPGSPGRELRGELSAPPVRLGQNSMARGHQRGNSHESTSWLESIEESGGSTSSSIHSRSSSMQTRRKHLRGPSGDTEAEFDAALDDAIEAAYDDGFDHDSEMDQAMAGPAGESQEDPEDAVTRALRRVELARERVRESEREALELVNERERQLRLQLQLEDEEEGYDDLTPQDFYDGNDSDEEERILEEMTQGYVIEDFTVGAQSRPSVPRESDSSGLTSRTWHSSMGSNPPTATTILTTVTESTVTSNHSKPPGSLPPPPSQALPQLPPQPLSAGSQNSRESVRNRRLSGQNPKQLKIETAKISPTKAPATAGPAIATQPRTGGYIAQQRQALSAGPNRTNGPASARPAVSPVPGANGRDELGTPPLPTGITQDGEPRSGSPSVPRQGLRKNFSSSSLRSMKSRNLSVSNIDDISDISPGTPMSNQFGPGSSARLPAMPSLPTPIVAAFKDRINNSSTGGLYLFESDFHSPRSPKSADPLSSDAPVPLEPCPSDTLLRPFWLMRCLYQTLCHPRGGYISNKLFVPRDVWRVKGVKIKSVEDKVASCDLLTAALQRLARADSNDADAVLDEMQALENVLEQVQVTLSRKLGNEVGVQSVSAMFREANAADDPTSAVPRSASVNAKGSSFSWRRLRSKNSSAGLGNPSVGKGPGGGGSASTTPVEGGGKDMLLPSLPMTSHPTSRPTKRDMDRVQFGGPNATYMSSLAKLFDAAQTIDQIARQVEDPGLRHADKTQVGLELCTRHAAEFFAFYICRFTLTDLTLLLDKFVKRGSEWVLA